MSLDRLCNLYYRFKMAVSGPEIPFRKHERTGRPLGVDFFIGTMELLLGRKLKPQKPGPKKKDN